MCVCVSVCVCVCVCECVCVCVCVIEWRGYLPASGQMPSNSDLSDWLLWYLHMKYTIPTASTISAVV